MSLMRNLSRGTRTAFRALGKGLSATGKALNDMFSASALSFGRGAFLTYVQTGGNDAIRLSEKPPTSATLNLFEIFIHRTITLAWLFGLLGSILANSYRSAVNEFPHLTNLALPAGKQLPPNQDHRSWFMRYVFGFPGFVLGTVFDGLGFLAVGTGRSIYNSWLSFSSIAWQITSYAGDKEVKPIKDSRSWSIFLLGLPGAILALPFGIAGFFFVGTLRSIYQSAITAKRIAAQIADYAWLDQSAPRDIPDRRTLTNRVLGSPGLVIGTIIGTLSALVITSGRSLSQSLRSFLDVTIKLTQYALPEKLRRKIGTDHDHWYPKHVLSFPGRVLGLVAGIIGFSAVGFVRVLGKSLLNFRALSGAILNVAFERYLFKGLHDTDGFKQRWALGLPGILLSLPIAAIGTVILTARKAFPLIIAFSISPLVGIWRAITESLKYVSHNQRFSTIENSVVAKFKALFTSLTPSGHLPEGQELAKANASPIYTQGFFNNVLKFFRKIFSFNQQSLTEELLTDSLRKYRESLARRHQASQLSPSSEITEQEHNELIKSAVNDSATQINKDEASYWLTSSQEKRERAEEVNNVQSFLTSYLQNGQEAASVPKQVYVDDSRRMAHLFFGGPKLKIDSVHLNLPTVTPLAEFNI
jgi:hypothetical protein